MRYPDGMTLRPLTGWPATRTPEPVRSPFSATWSATVELLDRELWYLGPYRQNAPSVLQVDIPESKFRVDGMPRADANPRDPAVILNIESRHGPLSYPCDKFTKWTDNVRAIALGLEALRKLERYGITPGNEQYTGWKALPQNGSSVQTAGDAEKFLRSFVDDEGNGLDLKTMPQIYRRACAKAHPDRGGDRAVWDAVEQAGRVLRAAGAL